MQYINDFRELTRDVFAPPSPNFTEDDYPNLAGKVYIVTGASSGIGFESAKLLVSKGAKVYITGRTKSKVDAAIAELRSIGDAEVLPIHHEDFESVRAGCLEFRKCETRLDGIVHNAGINYRGQNIVEPFGVLDIIVINVLSAQLIQTLLVDLLEATTGARVVWVTSAIHFYSPQNGGIDWDNMNEYDGGSYLGKGNGMYGQTKAMNIYQAILWAARSSSVLSVSVHPGTVFSDIRRSSWWRGVAMGLIAKPTIWGAYQVCQLMVSDRYTIADTGTYFVPFGKRAEPRSDVALGAIGNNGKRFWDWATKMINLVK